MWMGETPKNVAAVFRLAREQNAVLLFDEADAIASRRSTSVEHSFQRETNAVVSVLLQELEVFSGVVIFATNMAVNFDPAFERRIRTPVLFEMPGVEEREKIWRVQMHPALTPLAPDVDFRTLAERYDVSGGDIRNAVLKAAMAAASEPGSDSAKLLSQRHLENGIKDVLSGKRVRRHARARERALREPGVRARSAFRHAMPRGDDGGNGRRLGARRRRGDRAVAPFRGSAGARGDRARPRAARGRPARGGRPHLRQVERGA
jgi:SpoVK/Ycf46/Vps4 family AAA+-type ATPase